MPPTADSSMDPPTEAAETAAAGSSATSVPVTAARPNSWAKLAENPLQTLLATAVVALLIFSLTSTNASIADTNDRISRLEDRVTSLEDRVTRLEERVTRLEERVTRLEERVTRLEESVTRLEESVIRLEERMEARFTAQDAKIDEINLKLTALIATLNMTEQVNAAMAGTRIADDPPPDPGNTR